MSSLQSTYYQQSRRATPKGFFLRTGNDSQLQPPIAYYSHQPTAFKSYVDHMFITNKISQRRCQQKSKTGLAIICTCKLNCFGAGKASISLKICACRRIILVFTQYFVAVLYRAIYDAIHIKISNRC